MATTRTPTRGEALTGGPRSHRPPAPPTAPKPKRRVDRLFLFLLFGYALIAARLFFIQVVKRAEFSTLADRYHVRAIPIHAHRGLIKDRNGELLAMNADAGSVSLDPSFYWNEAKFPKDRRNKKHPVAITPDKERAVQNIAAALQLDPAFVRAKMMKRTQFEWLKRGVPLQQLRTAELEDIPGLTVHDDLKRMYPMGSLAAHVVGSTNVDGRGRGGIEQRFDRLMARADGKEVQQVDRMGRIIPGTLRSVNEPADGASVTLTIDSRIQQVAERELGKACDHYRAAGGTCTVMDPNTGEILAAANYPRYDPNQPGNFPPDAWRDRLVADLYEPGSTMKGLTASAAVNEHAVNLNERFRCPGFMRIGAHTVHDIYEGPGSFGNLNLAEILAHSSNVGMSQVGLRLGAKKLDEYVHAFGLTAKSGVDLPGEVPSWLPRLSKWDHHFTATVAFGQSVNFSALRLAAAYSAIANGGTLMKPLIVKRIEHPDTGKGPWVEETKPQAVRRVITPETARTVTQLLEGVVASGTGKPAKIRGYTLVGKTGSAQKAIPAGAT